MNLDDYRWRDAIELAALVQRGEVTARELVDLAIEAVEALNPEINAVLETFDSEVDLADPKGPLYGVPFLLKDLVLHRAGGRIEMGSRMAQGLVTPHDTELMLRFRRAGLVAMGRTAVPELGHGCTTESVLNGPTRNPWDRSKMAGGSSGGSAAAVAAGIVPIAHANDGAGSIRIPAACCGLFGLKPSRGRVSLGPDVGEALFGMGIEHVVSRSVRDSALVLDCIGGPAVGDPFVISQPTTPYQVEAKTEPGRLRIALTTSAWSGAPIDAECIGATWEVAKLCESLGHIVEEDSPQFEYASFREASIRAWAAGIVTWVNALQSATQRRPGSEFLETATWSGYEYGQRLTAAQLLEVPSILNDICRKVGPFFSDYDILLTPATSKPAQVLGTYNQNEAGLTTHQWFDRKGSFAPFLALFNATGQPAMTVPLTQSKSGLPIGSQFVAGSGGESLLFRLAGQLERAKPWALRRPVLAPRG